MRIDSVAGTTLASAAAYGRVGSYVSVTAGTQHVEIRRQLDGIAAVRLAIARRWNEIHRRRRRTASNVRDPRGARPGDAFFVKATHDIVRRSKIIEIENTTEDGDE